ncbi:cytosolic carboxypeptidase-like protein 5 isoform X2 [Bicyclus anynana]|uniref:Cytosolic carboxypeptidase-like protein 5 isoform X2 n=1 Tax=Bicyclus anynana TaxID=110368 RepID=A0ABM3LNL6_BICAN|nr:cytosolic carboxypeptidase-like protein 5 isoform X2 [Bicyclus anynana]
MDRSNIIESGGFYFIHNFDSGNLGHVERVPTEFIAPTLNPKTNAAETPDYEFNLWTRPDCAGTEFENGNRTWFYFGVQASEPNVQVRLNLINLNKQGKMYNQGMAPVTRTLPGKPQWERIRDRPIHSTDDNTFTLTFRYRTAENLKATTFFAFTYPFSFAELQIALNSIDLKMLPLATQQSVDDIYYCRECLIYSLEGRRVDLLTISSHHGITAEREEKLRNLFPENQDRPFKFTNKKIIFISARVHPGETPSSFVFNGFLNLLLNRNDPIAIQLRKLYVFKMIPFLNPDGVARGHYRTDTRGVNLNRVYLNPSLTCHPTVYASRALIRYYHFGQEKEEDICEETKSFTSRSIQNISESTELTEKKKKKVSNSPSHKTDKQKDKAKASNKSSIILKDTSLESCRDVQSLSGEASNLADQVYDMKLQEKPSQMSDISSNMSTTNVEETSSLLNDNVLRSCLGSNVHLSTSEELNIQGSNPLKPLRDTLKNSISLLMESSSSVLDEGSGAETKGPASKVKMGWCRECRLAVERLEDTMPGITNLVPGYSATMTSENDADNNESDDNVYFCTNCFKRYIVTENNEEILLCAVVETASHASVGVSAGDGSDVRAPPAPRSPAPSLGDSLAPQPPPKDEKPKLTNTKDKQPKKKLPTVTPVPLLPRVTHKEIESGLYLYIDLHGHASKKGIFMYGNHFEELESCVECMLLPRIMSLNNLHFHFSSCNFTERNMYLKDRRDGMSREGSGRVAVLKATGLVRSYTLECNYNTGRLVNVLPPTAREGPGAVPPATPLPPKYTPHIFEEVRHCRAKNVEGFEEIDPAQVGRSLGSSILDLTGQHPNSRIPCSEHRNLSAVREWLRAHTRTMRPQLTMSRLRPKTASPTRVPLYARSKAKVTDERKENAYVAAKSDSERKRSPPVLAQRSGETINMNMKFAKKNEPVKSTSRTRYLAENEPKPKTLSTKRRNILAVRKPNTSKTQTSGIVKAKVNRRAADDSDNSRALLTTKLSKRSFSRALRVSRAGTNRCRAMASSSSDDVIGGGWEDVSGGTALGESSIAAKRRPFSNTSPSQLKKIRLKSGL